MSVCLPCAKKIIDEGAATAVSCMEFLRSEIPAMVANGQVSKADAEGFLNDAIALESKFMADAKALMDKFLAQTVSPWDVPKG